MAGCRGLAVSRAHEASRLCKWSLKVCGLVRALADRGLLRQLPRGATACREAQGGANWTGRKGLMRTAGRKLPARRPRFNGCN